ncbi:MAG TPA: phosphatidate cytidylyltransferase [Geminicoccaceae bacterium]|nr:phosphatidate cytidylyltransferase [Geminicoccaceae bacterium]
MAERDPAFRLRMLSAVALLPVALAAVVLGGWVFAGCIALMVAVIALEWGRLSTLRFGQQSGRIAGGAALVVGVSSTLLIASGRPEAALVCLVGGTLLSGVVAWVAGGRPVSTSLGVAYVGLPALSLIWLRAAPELGLSALLWLLIVVWTTDTAAYFAGRAIGGPRLAPRISPGKTWSGLCGGMLGAALTGALTTWLLGSERLLQAAGLGAALALIAQAGDLAESASKRAARVKDSGSLIPGHGGLLDRVDGLLFAAPALALLGLIAGLESLPWR